MSGLSVLMFNWRDLNHPEAGGAEKYLVTIAEGLAARGHRVTFRTASYPGAVSDEVVAGVRYVRKGGHYSIYPRALAANLIGRYRPDVVIDVQNGVPYLSPLVRTGPIVNLVHHVHREQWPVVFGPKVARAGWWLESRVAPVVYRGRPYVAVSASTRRELDALGVSAERVTIIHNGTDAVRHDEDLRSPTPVVTVLGRLVPQKRVEIAMDAVATLSKEIPDLELRIVGSGYWEPQLREYAERLGIQDRTSFEGHVSEHEKHRLLAESWVHAMPSLKEGWGLVVVESGVHGTPTVAFRAAGGPSDSIVHGRTGLLVEDDEDSDEFTAALRTLLTDEELRHALSTEVATWVRQFHWDESVARWESLLLEVTGRSTPPSD